MPPIDYNWWIIFWTAANAVATWATLLALIVAALVALSQLSVVRGGNQIAALTECRKAIEAPEFREARRFIAQELDEPLFRFCALVSGRVATGRAEVDVA